VASGEFLFFLTPRNAAPDDTAPLAIPGLIAMTGTTQEETWVFDGGGTDATLTLVFGWPTNYDGGGIDMQLGYSTDGTDNTNAVEWDFQFMAVGDGDDLDTKAYNGTVTTITDTPSTGSANHVDVSAATSVTHAVCDSPAVGQKGYIKLTRTSSTDSNGDDGQFHFLYVTET
jgi:hypothetical protein